MSDDRKVFLGGSGIVGLSIVIVIVLVVVGAIFTIWYNYTVAVPLNNSERYKNTCSMQYLAAEKDKVQVYLDSISNLEKEIADPSYKDQIPDLQAQRLENIRSIYNTLDQAQCSREQILQDMPELQKLLARP